MGCCCSGIVHVTFSFASVFLCVQYHLEESYNMHLVFCVMRSAPHATRFSSGPTRMILRKNQHKSEAAIFGINYQ